MVGAACSLIQEALDNPKWPGFRGITANAPIAEQLRLTTIGIPWNTMVTEAVNFATQRVAGGSSAAPRHPRPRARAPAHDLMPSRPGGPPAGHEAEIGYAMVKNQKRYQIRT